MKACPVLRFKYRRLQQDGRLLGVRADAYSGPQHVGEITVARRGANPFAEVTALHVDKTMRRCGIGTKLYEVAARVACSEFRAPLHSDKERSDAAQGFWKKQERKGRATCVEQTTPPTRRDRGPAEGRGGCVRYRLSCPAPRSLAEARRR